MNAVTVATVIMAGCMVVGLTGSVLALTFRIGSLSGKVDSFMVTSERDRTDITKDIGRLEERHDRHIEQHHGGST